MNAGPTDSRLGATDPRPVDPRTAAESVARFEALLDHAERLRTRQVSFDRLRELGQLYRLHSAQLARLRERRDDPDAIRHLNSLCVRAYGILYAVRSGPRSPGLLGQRLPELWARTWRAQALAWTLLLLGAFVGGALAARDDGALRAFVPAALGYGPERLEALATSPGARERFLKSDGGTLAERAFFGSQLFANNTRVGLLGFATGILAGVPTALLTIYNGLMIGALSAIFLREPTAVRYAAWMLPHGIPELTAICLCAAGGFVMGGAVASPGRRRRREALRDAISPALLCFVASLPLFVCAALVEGFVRDSQVATAPRLVLAGGMVAALALALWAIRRLARARPGEADFLRELTA